MIHDILIENLLFDPINPRMPRNYEQKTDTEIIEWMLDDASLLDLISSIANNGYFAGEPLVVVKSEGEKYIVIEGNRRLAAAKILNNPDLSKVKKKQILELLQEREHQDLPTSLPCYEINNREEADEYLGFRHVTGVKSWGALEKAKYTFKLYEDYQHKHNRQNIYKSIAKKIGSKGAYIQRMILSYRLFQIIENSKFYGIKELDEENFEISLLADAATKYLNLQDFLGVNLDASEELVDLNHSRLKEVVQWLYEKNSENTTRVGESRNIRLLNAVVSNEIALKQFREGRTLEDSSKFTSLVEESFTNLINIALVNIRDAVQYVALLNNPNEGDLDKLKELNQQAVFLYSSLKNKQTFPELIQ
jgi:ParB-like nuclease domain